MKRKKKNLIEELIRKKFKQTLLELNDKMTLSLILENADLIQEFVDEDEEYNVGYEYVDLPDYMWRSKLLKLKFMYNVAYNILYFPQSHNRRPDNNKWLLLKYDTTHNKIKIEFDVKFKTTVNIYTSKERPTHHYEIRIDNDIFDLVPLKFDIGGVQSRTLDLFVPTYMEDTVVAEFGIPNKYKLRTELTCGSDRIFHIMPNGKLSYIELTLTMKPYIGKFEKRNVSFKEFSDLMQRTPSSELKPL